MRAVLLPVAYGALTLAASLLAARLAPRASRLERACAAALLVPALAIGIVYVLSAFHAIAPLPWIGCTAAIALAALIAGGSAAWAVLWSDAIAAREGARAIARDPIASAAVAVAAAAIGCAALSSYLLVPWAWDSLGYHLPIVHDAIQTGTLREVPTSVIYVNCYPRLVDVSFVGWRLSLGSETWVELAQLPYVPAAVLAIAAIAERSGVAPPRALALASLWIAIPVTMLELAAAYVDVAVASLALASITLATGASGPGTIAIAGIAIGLLLGSKPSAPPIAAIAMAALLWRSARTRTFAWGIAGCALALAIGVWKYVANLREHHDPIWPAELRLGGWVLFPGKASMAELASSGLREPYASMGWFGRLVSSWTAVPDGYVYDMRIGGFGPLFTFLLLPLAIAVPIAAARSPTVCDRARRIAGPVALLVLATLASPGAYWARYTLAIPGALLALAIALSEAMPSRARRAGELAAISLAVLGMLSAWRGFTELGPSLFEIARMDAEERVAAYALDGQEEDWERARQRVGEGEAFGYDWSYGLPGRLWRHDGRGRVAFLERTTPSLEELDAWIERERVRVLVLGEGPTGAADLARAHPDRFREIFRSDYPDWQPCAVFEVIPATARARAP